MGDPGRRLFAGFGVLIAVWIAVYWLWEPVPERLDLSEGSGGEAETVAEGASEATPVEPLVIRQSPVVREALPEPVPPRVEAERREVVNEAGVIPPRFRDYTIRSGDTLERIAQRELGAGRHWVAIAQSNPHMDPNRLTVGRVIRLPVDPGNIQGKPAEDVIADLPASESDVPPWVEYRVRRGDSLSVIASRHYGSSRYASLIFNANRDQLASMDSVREGQTLRLPPRPAEGD